MAAMGATICRAEQSRADRSSFNRRKIRENSSDLFMATQQIPVFHRQPISVTMSSGSFKMDVNNGYASANRHSKTAVSAVCKR